MSKNDYGAGHWSSDKVWDRRKKRDRRKEIIDAIAKNELYGGKESSEITLGRIMAVMDIEPGDINQKSERG